ncbi:hypothetical protein NM208_g16974 [Fusarium decemcellulare]|uniref:Uncharacterized protein n=1 Tax=Fusarium decemcellulare TaxID=57161 RepID=A0ACC1RAF3_9HYPO|nr:hypothetical protein NM208_g16974 [Fusarium decemcellulare]
MTSLGTYLGIPTYRLQLPLSSIRSWMQMQPLLLLYVQHQRFQGEHSSKKHVAASSAPKSSQAAAVISGCVCIAAHMGEFAVLLDEGFFARAWSVLRRLLLIHQERSNATFRIRLKESWNPGPADLLPLARLCRPWQAVR